jgi:hypothetical protein
MDPTVTAQRASAFERDADAPADASSAPAFAPCAPTSNDPSAELSPAA